MCDGAVNHCRGFTLIEMLVTVAISMFVLAGMSSLFVSQTRTAQALSGKSEVMNDLFLVSQIMQGELRGAKAICWDDVDGSLHYQPLSSSDNLLVACNSSLSSNGSFTRKNKNASHPTPYIFWDRVGVAGNQELIRDMKKDVGLEVVPESNVTADGLEAVRTITLTSQYRNREGDKQDLKLAFKVWPRNTQ